MKLNEEIIAFQEVPLDKGKVVLKILHTYHHTTSIFDDFIHYEKRQEEEDQRKVEPPEPAPPVHSNLRNDRGGRGGFHDRGEFHGNHHGMAPNHHQRDRDFGRDNPREFREHRGGRDGYNMHPRNDHRMDNRDQYNPRDERDRDPRVIYSVFLGLFVLLIPIHDETIILY